MTFFWEYRKTSTFPTFHRSLLRFFLSPVRPLVEVAPPGLRNWKRDCNIYPRASGKPGGFGGCGGPDPGVAAEG